MNLRAILVILMIALLLIWTACAHSPGAPRSGSGVVPPSKVVDFRLLYGQNCAGCHGADGRGGASIALANPIFLAIADDASIRRTAANGVPGTPMPAFAQSAGGMLTDKQLDVIVSGIRSWAKPDYLRGTSPPSYTAQAAGDPHTGAGVYATYCSACHGA